MVNLDHFFILSHGSNRVYKIMSIRVKLWWSVSAIKGGFVHWEKTVQNRWYSLKWPFQFVSRPSILIFIGHFRLVCLYPETAFQYRSRQIYTRKTFHFQTHFFSFSRFFHLNFVKAIWWNSLNDRTLRPMIVHFGSKDRPVWPSTLNLTRFLSERGYEWRYTLTYGCTDSRTQVLLNGYRLWLQ